EAGLGGLGGLGSGGRRRGSRAALLGAQSARRGDEEGRRGGDDGQNESHPPRGARGTPTLQTPVKSPPDPLPPAPPLSGRARPRRGRGGATRVAPTRPRRSGLEDSNSFVVILEALAPGNLSSSSIFEASIGSPPASPRSPSHPSGGEGDAASLGFERRSLER